MVGFRNEKNVLPERSLTSLSNSKLHVFPYSNISDFFMSYAELGKSANYSLKFNTKNVKMGLIKSKVGTAVV